MPIAPELPKKIMPIKNYKFHLIIHGELPEIFWEQQREMNSLWNAMIELRQSFLEDVKSLYDKKIKITPEELRRLQKSVREYLEGLPEKRLDSVFGKGKEHLPYDLLRETHLKKLRWQMFDDSINNLQRSAEWKARLAPDAREAVITRFRTASAAAAKTGATVRFKRTGFVDRVNFYHRFSGGGMDTEKLFTTRSKKIALDKVDEKYYADNASRTRRARYSNGYFGIWRSDVPLPIGVLFHRELPKGKIKTIQLAGKYNDIRKRWSWSFVAAVQTADEIPELIAYKPAAALDLNWRKMEEEYLRIGFVKDTAGNRFEIRLPLIDRPNGRTRSRITSINRARAFDNLPPLDIKDVFITNYYDLAEWQEKLDWLKDALKDKLKNMFSELPEDARRGEMKSFLTHYSRIGRRGLLKLEYQLLEAEKTDDREIIGNALVLLAEWREKDHTRRSRINYAQNYFTNKKKKIYENIALWLKRSFSHLVWEGDLSLKEMAEAAPKISLNSDQVAIKKGNKYRQFAGLYVLRSKISEHDETFASGDNWLIGVSGHNTTARCKICGQLCEKTAQRIIVCPKGHLADQDDQAASNMLEEIDGDGFIYNTAACEIPVPEHLQKYIIPYFAETGASQR